MRKFQSQDGSMTPSSWHDDARERDAGHDEMQIGAWEYIRKVGHESYTTTEGNKEITVFRHGVWIEEELQIEGKILSFVDILEGFTKTTKWADREFSSKSFSYRAFEVKPKIYSVGALLRQIAATKSVGKRWIHRSAARGMGESFYVIPLVRHDDEKLPLLKRVVNRIALWDGQKVSWWEAGKE